MALFHMYRNVAIDAAVPIITNIPRKEYYSIRQQSNIQKHCCHKLLCSRPNNPSVTQQQERERHKQTHNIQAKRQRV